MPNPIFCAPKCVPYEFGRLEPDSFRGPGVSHLHGQRPWQCIRSTPNDRTTLVLPRVSGVFFRVRSVFRKLLARESSRFHMGDFDDQQRSSKAQVRLERSMFRHSGDFQFATIPDQIARGLLETVLGAASGLLGAPSGVPRGSFGAFLGILGP